MSVFLAVDIDDTARAQAEACATRSRARFEAKWLPPEKLHVTVLFLGNPTPEQVHEWAPLVDALALRHRPFELRLHGAGTFVTTRAPSVLWLGVEGALEALRALQLDAVTTLGQHEPREYRPHLTLARAHTDAFFEPLREELRDFAGTPWRVEGLSLYESTHHRYHVLRRAPFHAP